MPHLFPTPKGDLTIRLASLEDAASLLDLRLESLTLQPEAFAADIGKISVDGVGAFEKLIADNARTQAGCISLACTDAELIGLAGITRGHWPKTRHFGVLWGVYVKPAWRGFHICEAMIDEIFEWVAENGMSVIYLGVTVSEKSAIRCYSRCGFAEYGIEPRAILYQGIYYDQVLMVKLL